MTTFRTMLVHFIAVFQPVLHFTGVYYKSHIRLHRKERSLNAGFECRDHTWQRIELGTARTEGRALSDLILLPEILLSTILKTYQKVSLLSENSMFGKFHRDHCTNCGIQDLPFIKREWSLLLLSFIPAWEAFYSLLWKKQ